jgi:hypothetical protein
MEFGRESDVLNNNNNPGNRHCLKRQLHLSPQRFRRRETQSSDEDHAIYLTRMMMTITEAPKVVAVSADVPCRHVIERSVKNKASCS